MSPYAFRWLGWVRSMGTRSVWAGAAMGATHAASATRSPVTVAFVMIRSL